MTDLRKKQLQRPFWLAMREYFPGRSAVFFGAVTVPAILDAFYFRWLADPSAKSNANVETNEINLLGISL